MCTRIIFETKWGDTEECEFQPIPCGAHTLCDAVARHFQGSYCDWMVHLPFLSRDFCSVHDLKAAVHEVI